jgi:TRAP-type C4-dicarboxylate transport system permease small subunit
MNDEARIEIINRQNTWWLLLVRFQKIILFVTAFLVILLISYSAIMRYVFKSDFYGIEDVILVVSFWMYFIGAAYGSYTNNHVSAEVIPIYLKNKLVRNIIIIIRSVVTTILSWLFTYWALLLMKWGIEKYGRTATLGIPLFIPQGAIFIGLFIMSIYTSIYLIEDILVFVKNKTTDLLMNKQEVA